MTDAALHNRIVGGILSNGLLLANVGTIFARYESLEAEADQSTILGAAVDAFEIALAHARLAAENGGRYPRGATRYSLGELEAKRFDYAVVSIAANGGLVPPGTAERFGIDAEQILRAAALAAGLREALS